jgi:hypothetical protein
LLGQHFSTLARSGRPVLDSPKRHVAPMPPTLTRQPVRSPGARVGLGATSSRRRHPVDGCSRNADSDRPCLGGWLANASLRTILASGPQKRA